MSKSQDKAWRVYLEVATRSGHCWFQNRRSRGRPGCAEPAVVPEIGRGADLCAGADHFNFGRFRQRQLRADRFKRNLGFEIWRMVFSFLHSGSRLSSCDPP